MPIQLRFVQFRDAGSRAVLPLRRLLDPYSAANDTELVTTPEWQVNTSHVARDSPVTICSAIATQSPAKIRIGVRRDPGDPDDIWIRAGDGSGGNLLGVIAPFELPFAGQADATASMTLVTPPAMVAVHSDVWIWEWSRSDAGPWEPLAETNHLVCVTLELPQSPWLVSDAWAPWIDVLVVVCHWAEGARSVQEIADRVTSAVFALGDLGANRFTYQGKVHLVNDDTYDTALFLAAFQGQAGIPRVVNCCDCAATVSTFANALGCRLFQAQIKCDFSQATDLYTNPLRLIGESLFKPTNFKFHELAWGGDATERDPIWDGCLMVDGDDHPAEEPHTGINGRGMIFGQPGDRQYMWRLVRSCSAENVLVNGRVVQDGNRQIGSIRRGSAPALDGETQAGRWFFWNFRDLRGNFPQWNLERLLPATETGRLPYFDSTFTMGAAGGLVRIRIEAMHSFEEALERLTQLRAGYSTPEIEISAGDQGIGLPDGSDVSFVRGNLVIMISSAAAPLQPVTEAAAQIDSFLIRATLTAIIKPAVDVTADFPLAEPDGKPLWYRIFSTTGEIRSDGDAIRYFSATNGPQAVTAFRHDAAGNVTSHVIPIQ